MTACEALPASGPGARHAGLRHAAPAVTLGLSGGVDSSVAALLLQRAGYRVRAVFMKNWEEDDHDGHCAAARDAADAGRVCERLGLPLARVSFATEYWERVFERFLADHRAGLTPNPDVLCNREIKFKAFLDFAVAGGADLIATGHYARVVRAGGRYRLLKGRDPDKDQSYFLYTLGQRQLARCLFPVGGLTKAEVRRLAAEADLPTHAKPGSTGICFIGERPFRAFLQRFLAREPGEIRTPGGELVGRHEGLAYYTVGQRHGLGIGGRPGAGEGPWYVLGKDPARNLLIVGQGHDHPALLSTALEAGELSWVAGEPPASPVSCWARVRYRQPDQPCRASPLPGGRWRVEFARPQRAVAPGQSVVLYDRDECLGGGVIERVQPAPAGG